MEATFDRYDRTGSGCLTAEDLVGLMGWLGRPHTIEQAEAVVKQFDLDGDHMLDKLELLLAVRQWQREEVEMVRSLFCRNDGDSDGIVTVGELAAMFETLGYTLLPHVIEEGIRTVKGHATGLMFEEVLHLLQRLRSQECFSAQERSDFAELFRKFDRAGRGQLRPFELNRALSWLGYPHTRRRRADLWVRVDMDKSGFVEQGEFLKMLRLLREEEASAAREALAAGPADGPLRRPEVLGLLHALGYAPAEAVLHEAMTVSLDANGCSPTTVQELLALLHSVRELQVARLRESGGLPDHILARIDSRFARTFTAGQLVEPQDLERLLHQLFPAVRHSEEECDRLHAFVAEEGAGIGSLQDLRAVVLRYSEQREELLWRREADAVASTGFSPAQVAQFREVFVKIDANGNGYLDEEEIHQAFEEAFARRMLRKERCLRPQHASEQGSACTDFALFLQLIKLLDSDSDS